jgi:hypothetical protein
VSVTRLMKRVRRRQDLLAVQVSREAAHALGVPTSRLVATATGSSGSGAGARSWPLSKARAHRSRGGCSGSCLRGPSRILRPAAGDTRSGGPGSAPARAADRELMLAQTAVLSAAASVAAGADNTVVLFRWQRDGVALDADTAIGFPFNATLVIPDFSAAKEGIYACVAERCAPPRALPPRSLRHVRAQCWWLGHLRQRAGLPAHRPIIRQHNRARRLHRTSGPRRERQRASRSRPAAAACLRRERHRRLCGRDRLGPAGVQLAARRHASGDGSPACNRVSHGAAPRADWQCAHRAADLRAQSTDSGTYQLSVTNAGGTALSAPLRVTVVAAKITSQPPAAVRALSGTAITMSVSYVSSALMSVDWLRDGVVVASGVTNFSIAR